MDQKKTKEIEKEVRTNLEKGRDYVIHFLNWMIRAVTVGIKCGLVGAVLHRSLAYEAELRMEHGWLLYFLPISGILIVFCFLICVFGYYLLMILVFDFIHSYDMLCFIMSYIIIIC